MSTNLVLECSRLSGADVVLGADWLSATRAFTTVNVLREPSLETELKLPDEHQWVPDGMWSWSVMVYCSLHQQPVFRPCRSCTPARINGDFQANSHYQGLVSRPRPLLSNQRVGVRLKTPIRWQVTMTRLHPQPTTNEWQW